MMGPQRPRLLRSNVPHEPLVSMPDRPPISRPSTVDEALPRPRAEVIFKPVADGGVLLHTKSEVYFGLNHLGARIWELLSASRDIHELCSRIETEHPGENPETIRTHVRELLDELLSQDLVAHALPRPAPSK